MNRISNLGNIKDLGRVVSGTGSIANHGGMYVKGTYGKQHVERTELSVMSYVQRMSYDGFRATSDIGCLTMAPGPPQT